MAERIPKQKGRQEDHDKCHWSRDMIATSCFKSETPRSFLPPRMLSFWSAHLLRRYALAHRLAYFHNRRVLSGICLPRQKRHQLDPLTLISVRVQLSRLKSDSDLKSTSQSIWENRFQVCAFSKDPRFTSDIMKTTTARDYRGSTSRP